MQLVSNILQLGHNLATNHSEHVLEHPCKRIMFDQFCLFTLQVSWVRSEGKYPLNIPGKGN